MSRTKIWRRGAEAEKDLRQPRFRICHAIEIEGEKRPVILSFLSRCLCASVALAIALWALPAGRTCTTSLDTTRFQTAPSFRTDRRRVRWFRELLRAGCSMMIRSFTRGSSKARPHKPAVSRLKYPVWYPGLPPFRTDRARDLRISFRFQSLLKCWIAVRRSSISSALFVTTALGEGDGMVVRRGYRRPPSFHNARLRQAPAGYFFDVITNGFGAMPDYAGQIRATDRWAIVAYIRALQLSQNATLADVPDEDRAKLEQGRRQ